MLRVCQSGTPIAADRLATCLLPEIIKDAAGATLATRPETYAPPASEP
jgi:hypothetical protein